MAGQNAEFTFLTGKRDEGRVTREDGLFCADDVNNNLSHKLLH